MPAIYAHYHMGHALLPTLPADARRTIRRFRQLYDVGLHGPDILFYHSPIVRSNIGILGSKFHAQTGQEFFHRACRVARQEKSEAAQAYLYGVLCHYALDSACHPFVIEQAQKGIATHTEIESEFERFLLTMDGKIPPESQNLSAHLHLTHGECETVAKFYPPVTTRNIKTSLRNMALVTKLLAAPEGPRRTLVRKGAGMFGAHISAMMIPSAPNPKCTVLNQQMLELYNRAIADFPILVEQLQAHMTYNGLFDEAFTKIFG